MNLIDFTEYFNDYFLHDFTFTCNDRVIKCGKLRLVKTDQFNITFLLSHDDKIKKLDVPYPFDVLKINGGYFFDYRLRYFKRMLSDGTYDLLKNKTGKSRLFNQLLKISIE